MRVLVSLLLIAVAACGPEEGAVLGFDGPDVVADRIEVVLASAKPGDLSVIDDPRAGYFRQRINIDHVEDVGALGALSLRIEPDALEAPDDAFIPFVFAFQDDALVGVATFTGADGKPAAITIEPGKVTKFILTVTPVTQVSADAPLAPSTGTVVECAGASAWRSGYAWQPPVGPQLRVLLPDPELDGAMKNATMRASDLDCDGHAAEDGDCDDLRSAIHPGATEACDGVDTDCDGALMELVTCTGANTCATESVSLCIDDGISRPQECVPSASCGCTAAGGDCARCELLYALDGNTKEACAPGVGKLHIACGACTVAVVATTGPWEVTIGTQVEGPFGPSTIAPGSFYVRAVQTSSTPLTEAPGGSVGEVFVAITGDGTTRLLPIDLRFWTGNPVGACPSSGGVTGDLRMECSP